MNKGGERTGFNDTCGNIAQNVTVNDLNNFLYSYFL